MNPVDIRYFKLAVGESRIKHSSQNDIQARCPICGDSKYSKSKARLHLYEKNGLTLVNCFNECAVQNKTMYKFLKQFYPSLLDAYKKETFDDKFTELKKSRVDDFDSSLLLGDLDLSLPKESEDKTLHPEVLFDLSSKFATSEKVYEYVEGRGLEWFPQFGKIFLGNQALTIDGKFYNLKDFIIIPLYYKDKMYGFYSRSLTEHKFYTYIPDKNSGWKIWNYFNIDRTKPVYVFEGIFDALAAYVSGITNVIACLGATPPLDKLQGLDLVFCLDNDRTGIVNAIKYSKDYKVVVYDNKYKDVNEMLKAGLDVKTIITNSQYQGIFAKVKLQRKL